MTYRWDIRFKTNLEGGELSRFLAEIFPWFRAHFASQRRLPASRMNPTSSTTAVAPCGPANAGITTQLENLPPDNEDPKMSTYIRLFFTSDEKHVDLYKSYSDMNLLD